MATRSLCRQCNFFAGPQAKVERQLGHSVRVFEGSRQLSLCLNVGVYRLGWNNLLGNGGALLEIVGGGGVCVWVGGGGGVGEASG